MGRTCSLGTDISTALLQILHVPRTRLCKPVVLLRLPTRHLSLVCEYVWISCSFWVLKMQDAPLAHVAPSRGRTLFLCSASPCVFHIYEAGTDRGEWELVCCYTSAKVEVKPFPPWFFLSSFHGTVGSLTPREKRPACVCCSVTAGLRCLGGGPGRSLGGSFPYARSRCMLTVSSRLWVHIMSAIVVTFSIMIWTTLIYKCVFWGALPGEKFPTNTMFLFQVPAEASTFCQCCFCREMFPGRKKATCRFYTLNWMCFYYFRMFRSALWQTLGWIFAISKPRNKRVSSV